ncbi:MAG: alpha-glucan family phosphorylase, partial [Acidimicrobiia bacterium]|nr:alpha-glucan family phosphorylase [Acidimicrobiia bacterium]
MHVPGTFPGLYDLAHNLWWSWDTSARRLWAAIDDRRWNENRNPLSLLAVVERERWAAIGDDQDFAALYEDVVGRFNDYLTSNDTWYVTTHGDRLDAGIAYLSAEFGVHATLPFYSGGLGVLAGDHAKAASDLGLPLVGVGLFYRRGYFGQEVDLDGKQQHHYYHIELARRPVRPVLDEAGKPLEIEVELPDRSVVAAAWRIDVGRVPLILLDTDVEANHPADRPITHTLYGRNREARLTQELVLGIGAVRILDALGIRPAVWHINEGHAAFSLLERLGISGDAAAVSANSVFTLHTPVPAGNEVFDPALVESFAKTALPTVSWDTSRELARAPADGGFNLSALAIRLTSQTNGVSRRHAEVASGDWSDVIGGPAVAITNAIHLPTWTGPQVTELWEEKLGNSWSSILDDPAAAAEIRKVAAADLWNAHLSQKTTMSDELRLRLVEQGARQGGPPRHLRRLAESLPPDRLTIVFARRFATYKRAHLLFTDLDRLGSILLDSDHPVQIVFAGKAHPADREGQQIIESVMGIATQGDLMDHVFFIENYDMELARFLVRGADVWLNNPHPPKEASGTSG